MSAGIRPPRRSPAIRLSSRARVSESQTGINRAKWMACCRCARETAPRLLPVLFARPLQHAVHAEPVHEGIEPARAGRFLGVHTKSMSALFVEVKLDRSLRRDPALDQSHAPAAEKRIVGGER